MGNVLTLAADTLGIVTTSGALALHAVVVFTTLNLLLVLFLVGSSLVYVWHI
jgi:hypothetical protein